MLILTQLTFFESGADVAQLYDYSKTHREEGEEELKGTHDSNQDKIWRGGNRPGQNLLNLVLIQLKQQIQEFNDFS